MVKQNDRGERAKKRKHAIWLSNRKCLSYQQPKVSIFRTQNTQVIKTKLLCRPLQHEFCTTATNVYPHISSAFCITCLVEYIHMNSPQTIVLKSPQTALFSHVIKLTFNSPVGTAHNLSKESVPYLVALAWGSARQPEIFNHDTFYITSIMQQ